MVSFGFERMVDGWWSELGQGVLEHVERLVGVGRVSWFGIVISAIGRSSGRAQAPGMRSRRAAVPPIRAASWAGSRNEL